MNPNNTIGLLDIDNCALIKGNSEINPEILSAFKTQGVKKILLFSSMSFSNVKQEYGTQNDSVSRKTLIETLEAAGFEVLGVITSIDPFYQQGLGRAYQDFYQPLYNQFHLNHDKFSALKNDVEEKLSQLALAVEHAIAEDPSENANETFAKEIKTTRTIHHRIRWKEIKEEIIYSHPEVDENGFPLPSFQAPENLGALKNALSQLWPWLDKLPNELDDAQKESWNKGCMFAYFLHLLPSLDSEIVNVIYLDDREDCLKTAEFLNRYNGNRVNLKTILADPLEVHQHISEQIQNHFEKIIISIPPQFLGYATYAVFEEHHSIERRMLTHFNDTVDYLRAVEKNNANGLPNDLTETLSAYLMVLFVNLMSELGCFPDIQSYECELSEEKNRVTFTCYFNGGDIFQVKFEIKSQLHFSLLGCTLVLNPLLMPLKQRNEFRQALNNSPSFSNDREIANELGHSRIYVLNHAKCDKVLEDFPNNSISRNKGTTAALATSGAGIIAAAVASGVALTFITGGAALPFIALGAGAAGGVSLIPGAGALTKKSIDKKNKIARQRSAVTNSAVTNTPSNQSSNRKFADLTVNEIKILNDFRNFILNPDMIKLLTLYKTVIDLYPEGYQTGIPQNFLMYIKSFIARLNAVYDIYQNKFNEDIKTLIDTLFTLEEIDTMDFNRFESCVSTFNLKLEDESYKRLLMAFQDGLAEWRMREFKKRFSHIINFVQNGGEMVSDKVLAEHIHTIADLLVHDKSETNINLGEICDVKNKVQLGRLQTVVLAMLTQLAQLSNPANNFVVGKLTELFGHIVELKQQLSQSQIQPEARPIAQEQALAKNNDRVMQGNNSAGFFNKPTSPINVPEAETATLNPSPTGSPQ